MDRATRACAHRKTVYRQRLAYYLKFDNWHIDQAAELLAGALPDVPGEPWTTFDGLVATDDLRAVLTREAKIKEIWQTNPTHGDYAEPAYFIQWAKSKGFEPPWLPWALKHGYFKAETDMAENRLNGRTEKATLHLVGALADLFWKATHPPDEEIRLVDLLEALEPYHDYYGMGERTIKEKLSKAISMIRLEEKHQTVPPRKKPSN